MLVYTYLDFHVFVILAMMIVVLEEQDNLLITGAVCIQSVPATKVIKRLIFVIVL